MIGRIAIKPAARWTAWRPVPRRWRVPVWWRLALAPSGEPAPMDSSPRTSQPNASGRADDTIPGTPRDPRSVVDALYQQHARSVLAYLYHRLPNLADAEDALGEVFVAALHACAAGTAPDLPWLLLVARRRVADFYRARARGGHLTAPDEVTARTLTSDPSTQPEALSLRAEEAREVRALIATLPDEQREVLALRFAAGLRAPQIGVLLGKSEDAVRALLSRAVRRLRQQWDKEASR